jgi:hypothetical protein
VAPYARNIQSGATACCSSRGRGEIGRRAGFRCRWAKVLGGSSPSARMIALRRAAGTAPGPVNAWADECVQQRSGIASRDRNVVARPWTPPDPKSGAPSVIDKRDLTVMLSARAVLQNRQIHGREVESMRTKRNHEGHGGHSEARPARLESHDEQWPRRPALRPLTASTSARGRARGTPGTLFGCGPNIRLDEYRLAAAGQPGLEPGTSGFGDRRFHQLSYCPMSPIVAYPPASDGTPPALGSHTIREQ